MIKTMLLNLTILANVCLTIPVGTALVEHPFSHINVKIIKSCLRNRLGEHNFFTSDENYIGISGGIV